MPGECARRKTHIAQIFHRPPREIARAFQDTGDHRRERGSPKDPLFWLKRIKVRPLAGALAVVAIIALSRLGGSTGLEG